MSQSALGEKVGVTFQQIQKYELGQNRAGSSRLKKIATVLDVPIAALFGDNESNQPDPNDNLLTDLLSQPYAGRLLRAFYKISDVKERIALLYLAEEMATTKK